MSRIKTKNILFLVGFVLLVLFLFLYRAEIKEVMTHEKEEKQEQIIANEKQKNQELNSRIKHLKDQVSSLEDETTEEENVNSDNKDQEEEKEAFLKDFAERWINFRSIEERNKSVKSFLTEKAIYENGIDAELKVEFQSEGEVKKIAKVQDEKQESYMILVDEKARDEKNTMLIEVSLKQNQIEDFSARYVDSEFEGD
ncbi:EF0163 family protein [Tetragenococcus halophilus]